MKTNLAYFIFVFTIVLSCKTAEFKEADIQNFENLIASKNFTIESDRAYPLITNAMQQVLNSGITRPDNAGGVISLIGNYNFLTIKGDSISSHLPYFGERRMSGDYGGADSTIELEGLMKDYTVTEGKNKTYTITFDAKSKGENFKTQIIVFPSLKAEIQLSGTTRTFISYSGTLAATANTKEGK
ncbi:DUF4251 domain-containing protein [Algibacter pectinivorans]|uniref:DUF4251 domain-containing protein n=1 Tax=Algibacter pectinivorans TaxID=870482 RepID=A0A1I1SAL7_9FLAO|nr:DUF4251 domain-containing protein [Algibacter pectinivorans]SFD40020.1 protein of unknown function [Algibacter pectinivorans]